MGNKTLHLPINKELVKIEDYREVNPCKIRIRCPVVGVCDMQYTHVKFSDIHKRTMTFEVESITIIQSNTDCRSPNEGEFIIKLGKKVTDENN